MHAEEPPGYDGDVTRRLEFSDPAVAAEPDADPDVTQPMPVVREPADPGPVVREPMIDAAPARVPVMESAPPRTRTFRAPDIGRRLRGVAGVDEALIARVPQERARYTALGGVVVGTALIAAFSMWFAISEAVDTTSGWIIVPALIWGLFIFNFDRWLISSAVGLHWHRRYGTLIMRVLMALLFGIIIAEPLVLRVFQSAIVKSIQDQRTADLATLRTKLVDCNPESSVPGGATAPAGCSGYVLAFPTTPGSLDAQLAAKRADAAKLSAEIATDTKQLDLLNNQARLECVGASGPGFTGHEGVGPNCDRLRAEADAYAKAHPIATETSALTAIQNQISGLEAQVASSQGDFEKQRAAMIDRAVATAQSHQGPIGILERMGALSKLAASSSTLRFGTWAVRLLFIMVDCMPILVKFFGGVTTYDRLVDRELAYADANHAADIETANDERLAAVRRRRDEIDVELREHRAVLGSRVSRAVHDLATEYVEPSPRPGGVYGGRPPATGVTHNGASGRAPVRGNR
jgi:Domain of unknown function (DUF4407)